VAVAEGLHVPVVVRVQQHRVLVPFHLRSKHQNKEMQIHCVITLCTGIHDNEN
jgi:hypothetical protein